MRIPALLLGPLILGSGLPASKLPARNNNMAR